MNRILIVLLLALLVLLIVRRVQSRKAVDKPAAKPSLEETQTLIAQKSTPYHAVSIQPGSEACRAARELKGKRFLSSEAPSLPLANCTLADCQCHFVHHADRRSPRDRRSDLPRGAGTDETGQFRKDRRQGTDRRRNEDGER